MTSEVDSSDSLFAEEPGDGPDEKRARASVVLIRLALPPYTIHFKSPTYLQQVTLDLLDNRVVKETVKSTSKDQWVRAGIGCDPNFWYEFVLLLRAARPSLERRSFQNWDPSSVDYDSTSGALIAGNYPGLWRDIERLNDIVCITRNVLTIGNDAQELACNYAADLEIFHLINCCVRVTARGYDGSAGTGEEEKWQWIVNAYKKLLITSVQFLNNLVAQNEGRKSMLWTSLFDHSSEIGFLEEQVIPTEIAVPKKPTPPITSSDILLAYGMNGSGQRVSPFEFEAAQPMLREQGFLSMPANAAAGKKKSEPNGYVYFTARYKEECKRKFQEVHGRQPTIAEIHRNIPHFWNECYKQNSRVWAEWQGYFEAALDDYRDAEDEYADYLRDPEAWKARFMEKKAQPFPRRTGKPWKYEDVKARVQELEQQMADETKSDTECAGHGYCEDPATCEQRAKYADLLNPLDARTARVQHDLHMLFTAQAGAKILESGKAELMKRLEGYADPAVEPTQRSASVARSAPVASAETNGQRAVNGAYRRRSSSYAVEEAFAEESMDEEEEEEESEEGEEEDDEEDYPGSTEDGRGLLTDVPLILGPSEIEVLPMLIMSGLVVPPAERAGNKRNNFRSIETTNTDDSLGPSDMELREGARLRTHLLLSQTPGRNLLRELLIFVAAWDLREEELYFKFMVRILEAILQYGLMPYAYHAFRDRSRSKDIISPAQAVIMKLLTCIFRQKNENIRKHLRGEMLEGEVMGYPRLSEAQKRNAGRPPPGPEEAKWLEMEHRMAVNQKQRLGLLPSREDIRLLNYVFTEFRQHIIPQTCALIFLQGQIHRGRASPDDFPLNLWDMERMYEGVYQFLEFFAVLSEEQGKVFVGLDGLETVLDGKIVWTEELQRECQGGVDIPGWKMILAQWEMCYELVTLLRELEGGIPKVGDAVASTAVLGEARRGAVQTVPASSSFSASAPPPPPPPVQRSQSADAVTGASRAKNGPVSVEHPFDPLPPSLAPGTQAPRPIFEPETPLAFPEDTAGGIHGPVTNNHVAMPPQPDLAQPQHHDQDEPSDFEWRNLKKLTVLVLSSLIWKNPLVQEQLRRYGGLEALVGCCRPDENNPHIREHAIMCIRFAVEGCEENADALIRLAGDRAQSAVNGSARGRESMKKALAEPSEGKAQLLEYSGPDPRIPAEILANRHVPPGGHAPQSTAGGSRSGANGKAPFNFDELLPTLTAAASAPVSRAVGVAGPSTKLSAARTPAEEGRELIRQAALNFSAGQQAVEDWERSEALQRLDRVFESTEAALSGAAAVLENAVDDHADLNGDENAG